MKNVNTNNLLESRANLRIKLIIQGAVVGLFTGLVIVLNRIAISKFSKVFKELYISSKDSWMKILGVFCLLAIMGLLTGLMVKKDNMISGSGIPQVKGILLNKLKMNWFRILIYKFVGGVLALTAGLSVGREGPSVQIGASIGEGYSKLSKRDEIKKDFLITAGASAGLTAAFNSPLSGVIFALEEVHRSFSTLVLITAMSSALVADFITKNFLGMDPVLDFSSITVLPLKYYWALLILGIIVGCSGVLFSKGILVFQNIYGKFKKLSIEYKVMIPFLVTGIVGFLAPKLLGGGHDVIMSLSNSGLSIKVLLIIFILKFLLILICFGSGVPGGIFLPLLLLGALLGDIFGLAICNISGIPTIFIINFIILAMAGHFASIVKAPITGIVLILEMTGSFDHILSIAIVVLVSYVTSDILRSEPIYESLLERLLHKVGIKSCNGNTNKKLLEIGVEIGSHVEGKLLKNLDWPKECLLVAIKRGDQEIIPRGDIRILAGDYLVALVNDNNADILL
ncbi:ClC family H(+)/Cl(-) exchange transporter, partial [Clostridium tarantellae]